MNHSAFRLIDGTIFLSLSVPCLISKQQFEERRGIVQNMGNLPLAKNLTLKTWFSAHPVGGGLLSLML